MKRFASDFFKRGMMACGIGPIVLAVLYLVLYGMEEIRLLSVNDVCIGIFSLTALAFVAGGMNAVYQIERLPLMVAILIHGSVLYVSYLMTYLVNDWLERGVIPILVFSGVFAVGYIVIWIIVYSIVKRKTAKLNVMLMKKQQN